MRQFLFLDMIRHFLLGDFKMNRLILLRHGESLWNHLNLFTGWVDVPLTEKGIEEALAAGKLLQDLPIDIVYASTLSRALMTAMIAMSKHKGGRTPIISHPKGSSLEISGKIYSEAAEQLSIPVYCNSALNERMYGQLQGLNKAETKKRYGEEQVKIWRRSYDTPPPGGESLADTAKRTLPFFEKEILPLFHSGKNILVVAHGNSLRSIIMMLDGLNKEQVLELEIPTGLPILYQNNTGTLTRA